MVSVIGRGEIPRRSQNLCISFSLLYAFWVEGVKPAWYKLQTVWSSCSTSSLAVPLPIAALPVLELVLAAFVPPGLPVEI